jgi:hypothetical protein
VLREIGVWTRLTSIGSRIWIVLTAVFLVAVAVAIVTVVPFNKPLAFRCSWKA